MEHTFQSKLLHSGTGPPLKTGFGRLARTSLIAKSWRLHFAEATTVRRFPLDSTRYNKRIGENCSKFTAP